AFRASIGDGLPLPSIVRAACVQNMSGRGLEGSDIFFQKFIAVQRTGARTAAKPNLIAGSCRLCRIIGTAVHNSVITRRASGLPYEA
ncbi:MAG: hypothetical protein KGL56_04715, partial [Alphaproteobacteria bacterium]|nr:hypothetical protein [Alphaproteobacteria bacterium]